MALEAPKSIEMPEIQFRRRSKLQVFRLQHEPPGNANLLAVSSSKGILFASDPEVAKLNVFFLKELVTAADQRPRVRVVNLPQNANLMACSADGSMLAVALLPLKGVAFMQIYSVACFTTPNVTPIYTMRLSAEFNVNALQLLWNPVLVGNLTVILSNGALGMYTLKGNGNFELHSLDKSQQVKCGCWSPKGKQIVLGFPSGKLQQFKPDLTPAKTIACPAGVHAGPFDTIALHWLSTFQFAAVFLQHGQDMSPSLYIVNAPKGGAPSYINYNDICYSACGPRAYQFHFTHVQQWNLLLITSATGVEVGMMGTKETGETPTWHHYTLLDEARIEMPLAGSDETYPMGLAFDTSSSHQLSEAEVTYPVMPMVHMLSTHGVLMSFDFLNLTPGAVDVCSPPPPLNDMSGEFVPLMEPEKPDDAVSTAEGTKPPPSSAADTGSEASFAFASGPVTSTPAVRDKPASLFANLGMSGNSAFGYGGGGATSVGATIPTATFGLPSIASSMAGQPTSTPVPFAAIGAAPATDSTPTFGAFAAKPLEAVAAKAPVQAPHQQPQQKPQTISSAAQKPPQTTVGATKKTSDPLYSISTAFTPPPSTKTPSAHTASALLPHLTTIEYDEALKEAIATKVASFDIEMKHIEEMANNWTKKCGINVSNLQELKTFTKRLNDLREINEQAKDRDFVVDVIHLQQSLTEIYSMRKECQHKLQKYNNPDMPHLATVACFEPMNKRVLSKLQNYLTTNQLQMQQLQQQIDVQWAYHQDFMQFNSKMKMYVPSLDGMYQRIGKLKENISRQRIKLNYIRAQCKQRGMQTKALDDLDAIKREYISQTNNRNALDILVQSILSRKAPLVVDMQQPSVPPEKMIALRKCLMDRQHITVIKSQRPDRVSISSEVVLEARERIERKMRMAQAEQEAQRKQVEEKEKLSSKTTAPLPKPTATKPSLMPAQNLTTFAAPVKGQAPTASFNFGNTSPFVKTSVPIAVAASRADESMKPFASTNLSEFSHAAAPQMRGTANPVLKEALATPISFAAKVISGGEAATVTNADVKSMPVPPPAPTISGFTTLTTMASNNASIGPAATKPTSIAGFTTLTTMASNNATATLAVSKPTAISGFATLTPTPSINLNATPMATKPITFDKENFKPEQTAAKPFTFGQPSTSPSLSFGVKPELPSFGPATTTNTLAKTSLFDSKMGAMAIPSSNSFSFAEFGNAFSDAATTTTAPTTMATTASTPGFMFGATVNTGLTSATPLVFGAAVKVSPDTGGEAKALSTAVTTVAPATSTSSFATYSFNNDAWDLTTTAVAGSTVSTTTVAAARTETTTTNSTIPSTNVTAVAITAPSVTPTVRVTATATSAETKRDPTDTILGNLTICKANTTTATVAATVTSAAVSTTPATTGDTPKTSMPNLFSGFGSGGGVSSSAFSFSSALPGGEAGISKPTFTMNANSFSFAATAFGQATTTTIAPSNTTDTTTIITTSPTTTVSPATAAPIASASILAVTKTTVSESVSSPAPVTATATHLSSFGELTVSSLPATTTTPTTSILGGTTAFLTTTTTTNVAAGATTSPLFGGKASPPASTGATSPSLIFSAAAAATPALSADLFGAAEATTPQTSANIFGGFGTPTTASPVSSGNGIFAAAAAANPSPFAKSPVAGTVSGSNIFGGAGAGKTNTFGAAPNTTTSIFGGSGAVPFGSNTGSSIFGGTKSPDSSNVFGTPTQPTVASGGSMFGQSAFGGAAITPPSSNPFGGIATAQQAGSNAFGGGGGSIFGGVANANSGGGPLFGSGGFSQVSNATPFGSSSTSGTAATGPFAQTGSASVAQTGFGASSVFGGSPSFGSPPTFGNQPSFGGAATFGSPKGFGSFGVAANPPATSPTAFGAGTQKSNLFETLGASESGLSFGNLAQANNPNANKSSFGGSSFMNYRA